MATLYERYITGDDNIRQVWGAIWLAQTFTPSVSHTITSVKLKIGYRGAPGNVTISIRATTAGLPSGADLCSVTVNGNTFTAYPNTGWTELTFDSGGTSLTASATYAIIVSDPTGDVTTNYIRWADDGSSPTYANGSLIESDDSGVIWAAMTTIDMMFEDWGDEITTAPTVTTQAATAISGTTATGNGNVTSLGDSAVTAHGHCWNTTGTPTTSDSKVDNGAKAATGAFTSAMTSLTAGTKYYVRAYAVNGFGTAYGNQVEFWADKGTVFPSDPITRVTSLVHRYDRRNGIYQLEISLGDTTSVLSLPYSVGAQLPTAEAQQEQDAEPVVKEATDAAVKKVIAEQFPYPSVSDKVTELREFRLLSAERMKQILDSLRKK